MNINGDSIPTLNNLASTTVHTYGIGLAKEEENKLQGVALITPYSSRDVPTAIPQIAV